MTILDVNALFALASVETTNVPAPYQAKVADFIDFVGCVLGIVLSERQVDWLRTYAVKALSAPDGADAKIVESTIANFQAAKGADAAARHGWRQQNQGPFVQWIGNTQSEICQALRQWHADAQQVLAAAQPPLTREAAESWAELWTFAELIAQGKEPGTAAPENLEAVIAKLARDYPTLPQRQRLWIAFAPITLYEIRRSWPTLPAAERETLRRQLAAQFNIHVESEPAAPPSAAPAPPAARPRRSAQPSSWDRFRQAATSVEGLQQQWSEAQARGDQQEAARLQMEIQKSLQRAAESNAMLTNILSMKHSMAMAVANNLKY